MSISKGKKESERINSRRSALKKIGAALAGTTLLPHIAVAQNNQEEFKILIKNGLVFLENKLVRTDIAVDYEGRIRIVDFPTSAKTIIDAEDKVVSPGWIDILADNGTNPKQTYKIFEKYKVSDGLTTVLQMHGGSKDNDEYHKHFDGLPHAVNYGVSTFVMMIRNSNANLTARLKLVEKNLQDGALGVSHSIEYQPTGYEEVKEYAKLAKKYDRPMFLHLRHSSPARELDGVKEVIRLAKDTGARLHIDHLNSTGGTYNMPKALELIDEANKSGLEITCCVYPYSYWATYLSSKRFDPGWRENYGMDYSDLSIVGTGEKLTKSTFDSYRSRQGLLVAVPEGTMPFNKTIDLALQYDFCMIGSDGGIQSEPRANNHPRGAGCFATAIKHCLDIGLSLESALSKVTTLPGNLMRPILNDRCVIQNGAVADLTIFDPKTINGRADVANPNQFSQGIHSVILNGELVFQNELILATNGKAIRYSKNNLSM